jgi:hypothetical protein
VRPEGRILLAPTQVELGRRWLRPNWDVLDFANHLATSRLGESRFNHTAEEHEGLFVALALMRNRHGCS